MASPEMARHPLEDKLALAYKTPVSFLRYSRSMPWKYDLQQAKHKEMLYRALNLGTTIAFLGAGCSRDFELPTWEDFAREAVLRAWYSLSANSKPGASDDSNTHRGRYERNVLEFATQLTMQSEINSEAEIALKEGAQVGMKFLRSLQNALRKNPLGKKDERKKLSGDELRFILGACKQICDWCDSKALAKDGGAFLRYLQDRFAKQLTEKQLEGQPCVHHKLLTLPFHRFITSNYDLVLEQFLAHKLGQSWKGEPFQRFLKEKAFTQADRDSAKLARFAAGMSEDSRNMVFHCHGWCLKADSMIVTEENYQDWYLGDADGAGPAFRQTMELLVGSHPILFVGFRMNDPDLLMALRTLSATEPERKAQRSLFALLPENEAKDGAAMERLFEQFGVHVIGYKTSDSNISASLSKFLGDLVTDWVTGRESWLLKPKIHSVVIPKQDSPNEYWHYELNPFPEAGGESIEKGKIKLRQLEVTESPTGDKAAPPVIVLKPKADCQDLDLLVEKIAKQKEDKHLIALVGPGGSGKSFCATQLVKRLMKKNAKFRCCFWSSYYADDALTGIIRANNFFLEEQPKELSRLERFQECLKKAENIFVFDGMERFLLPVSSRPDVGTAANSGVSDFLTILKSLCAEGRYQATVIITTRLVPEQLAQKELNADFFKVVPMTIDEANYGELKRLSPDHRAALVALLGGHHYAMDLAARWPHEQICKLIHHLGNVGLLRHIERIIELTLCRIEPRCTSPGGNGHHEEPDYNQCNGKYPYELLMKRLAVFMGPIKKLTTFRYCYDLAKKEWEKVQAEDENLKRIGDFPPPDNMWNELITNKLLFNVDLHTKEDACVMHAVVREFVFHRFHQADARKLASFTQAGFTSGANMVDPGENGAKIIDELFCELRRQCREAYKLWKPAGTISKANAEEAQGLCGEAFGLLRSRMLANTVTRWGSYKNYIHYLVRMGDLARAYCGKRQLVRVEEETNSQHAKLFWSYWDPASYGDPSCPVIHEHGPLFGDELAWLYHELGLALYHQGAMIDCLGIWEQGLEINRFLDGSQPGQYTFQAYCNLGAASIQYGRLPRAREYFQMAKGISLRAGDKDKDHVPRLNGYLALIRHLRGDLLLADEEYDAAIMDLKKTNNLRAECIFLRHWADLKLRLKDKDLAENYIRSCRSKAEEGHFPDLVAHARLSEGHLLRTRKRYQDAIREYKIALNAAKQYGMHGLEADVHSEMARLALDLGDTETARTRAIKSLQIANELHLGLRQTHGLVVLGKATAEAGQRTLGVEYLKQARELAARQHYELRAREAEEELHRLHAVHPA